MKIPDNTCNRLVIPGSHLPFFHMILIYIDEGRIDVTKIYYRRFSYGTSITTGV